MMPFETLQPAPPAQRVGTFQAVVGTAAIFGSLGTIVALLAGPQGLTTEVRLYLIWALVAAVILALALLLAGVVRGWWLPRRELKRLAAKQTADRIAMRAELEPIAYEAKATFNVEGGGRSLWSLMQTLGDQMPVHLVGGTTEQREVIKARQQQAHAACLAITMLPLSGNPAETAKALSDLLGEVRAALQEFVAACGKPPYKPWGDYLHQLARGANLYMDQYNAAADGTAIVGSLLRRFVDQERLKVPTYDEGRP